MRETVWCRKIVRPIPEFLRQGLTPESSPSRLHWGSRSE